MDIFESLENLNVSEECFDEILGIVEEIILESTVDDYYAKKIADTKQELANAKSEKRHLNKTVDAQANKEYRKAKGAYRQANQDAYNDLQNAHQQAYHARNGLQPGAELKDEHEADYWVDDKIQKKPDQLKSAVDAAKKKFSQKGTELYNKITDLKNQRDSLQNDQDSHVKGHVERKRGHKMDIFESLENLAVSEECFDDIMGIVESIFEGWADSHTMRDVRKAAARSVPKRREEFNDLQKKHHIDATNQYLVNKIPEVKRAHDRYIHAHINSLGSDASVSDEKEGREQSKISTETNKVYPDNLKVSTALRKKPRANIVKYNVTPHIKSLGK